MIPHYTTYACTLCPYKTTKQTGCTSLPIKKCPICGSLMKAKKTSFRPSNPISQVADIIESVVEILIKRRP